MIRHVPTAGQLPSDWTDGYWVSGGTLHVLTRHLSIFALTGDTEAPTPPMNLNATVNDGKLTLYWDPGSDNSGTIANFVFFVDDQPVKNLGGTETQYTVGPFDPDRLAPFSIVELDTSGNASTPLTVKVVPSIVGLSLDDARAALLAAGFAVGDVTVVDANAPAGTVVGPTNLTLVTPGRRCRYQLAGAGTTSAEVRLRRRRHEAGSCSHSAGSSASASPPTTRRRSR